MVTTAEVHLWEHNVGTVFWNEERGVASFEYDPSFVSKGLKVAPITMPLSDDIYSFPDLSPRTFMGLPGMLAEALPDAFGRALLDNWLAAQGRENANPVERLCFQGQRSMGAL